MTYTNQLQAEIVSILTQNPRTRFAKVLLGMQLGLNDTQMAKKACAEGESIRADGIQPVRNIGPRTLDETLVTAPSEAEEQANLYRELLNYPRSPELHQHIITRLTQPGVPLRVLRPRGPVRHDAARSRVPVERVVVRAVQLRAAQRKGGESMTVWFTSDLHLNHRAVAWQRLIWWWPNPDERRVITPELCRKHDDHLARRWDKRVQPDDQIWMLGDLVANAKDLPYALRWIQERAGRKHMVFGNRDAGHPLHGGAHKWEDRYRGAFESVGPMRTRKMTIPNWSTHRVVMSHFPYEGARAFADDRYQPYRLRDGGMPLIHGDDHRSRNTADPRRRGCLGPDPGASGAGRRPTGAALQRRRPLSNAAAAAAAAARRRVRAR